MKSRADSRKLKTMSRRELLRLTPVLALRAAEGRENKQIAQQMGITPEKVARWRNRFVENGIAALENDPLRSGRTRTITDRQVK
jgi:transposase